MSEDTFGPQNPQPSAPNPSHNGGSRPVPDPTILTMEALIRQTANLKELLQTQIDALVDIDIVRFAGIDKQFDAIEAWRKEQKLDTKIAVDAAMSAAEKARQDAALSSEKAITKSETSAMEQSKQQFATFNETTKALATKHDDLKERVLRIESFGLGTKEANSETRNTKNDNQGLYFALITVASTLVLIIIAAASVAVALTR